MKKYKCPCCGYYTFEEPIENTFAICPVCFWEDDGIQLLEPNRSGGANYVSLNEAKANYNDFGACEKRLMEFVREPSEDELNGIDWKITGDKIIFDEDLKARNNTETDTEHNKQNLNKRLPLILIIIGAAAFTIYFIFTKIIYNISTVNNWAAIFGALTCVPIFIGLFIYGIRGRKKEARYSRSLIWVSTLFFLLVFISILVEFIETIMN